MMKVLTDTKQYQILIIEDNIGDFTLIQDYLEEKFIAPKVFWAKNFKEGKATLLEKVADCDIILLDLSLPDKSGEQLIHELLPLCANIPLVILTGYSDIAFGAKSLSLGVSDYLVKDELNAASLYKSILYNIERKKNLIQIENSEKRYSDLFHLSPIPMWVFDTETLRFLDVNLAAERHYGYTLQEFLGMKITDIRPAEDIPMLLDRVKTLNESEPLYSKGTYRHKKKNGEIIHVDIQSNTIPFQDTVGRIILANDVTERFTYIEAIEKQNEKLKEISWIQSHVVRAPLARMMGLIDIIKNQGYDCADSQEIYNHLLVSAEELDVIVKDIAKKSERIKIDFANENEKT